MDNELQRASLWKRIAAGILDLILVVILATGIGAALSSILKFDSHFDVYYAKSVAYAEMYQIDLEMTTDKLAQMSPQEQEDHENRAMQAEAAFNADPEASRSADMILYLSLSIVTGSVLISMVLLELVVPILFGNGQTVGKKIFALCVVRTDGVKITGIQHFTRVILGKFAVETMIPIYTAIMLYLGIPTGFFLLISAGILLGQCVIVLVTRNHSLFHDLMAGTVVADHSSQKIFQSTEELIAYQKRIAAERAARQTY